MQLIKTLGVKRAVDLTPPDVFLAGWLPDDEFIVGRTSGMVSGADDQRAKMAHQPLPAANNFLIQGRGGQIPINVVHVDEAMGL